MKRASTTWATWSRSPRAGRSPRPRTGLRPAWSRRPRRSKPPGLRASPETAHNVRRFFFPARIREMPMIKVGEHLPEVTLQEYSEVEGDGCSIGPNPVKVKEAAAGKTIAL